MQSSSETCGSGRKSRQCPRRLRAAAASCVHTAVWYRDVFGVTIDEATGTAIENWNDPDFIGAPSAAIDDSAAQVAQSTALGDAVSEQAESAATTFANAVEDADFASIGDSIVSTIESSVSKLDLSQATVGMVRSLQDASTRSIAAIRTMMTGISSSISSNSSGIKQQASQLASGIITALNTLGPDGKKQTDAMMNQMQASVSGKRGGILNSVKQMAAGITDTLKTLPPMGKAQMDAMMTQAAAAIAGKKDAVISQAKSVSAGCISALSGMAAGGRNAADQLMAGVLAGLIAGSSSVYQKANEIANTVAATMKKALQVRSPSRVMIGIFKNVMRGAAKGLDDMKFSIYSTAAGIATGISKRLTPELAIQTNASLLGISNAAWHSVPMLPAQTSSASSVQASENKNATLLQKAVDLLDKYLPEAANTQLILDTGKLVGEMAPAMDTAMGHIQQRKERG